MSQHAFAQQAPICYVPADVLGEVEHALAFYSQFHLETVWVGQNPVSTALQYTWFQGHLRLYLPEFRLGLSYNCDADADAEVTPFRCLPPDSTDFIPCVKLRFGLSAPANVGTTLSSGLAYSSPHQGDRRFPIHTYHPRSFCTVSLAIPAWHPSPMSDFKRYVIDKIEDRLDQEIPGTITRIVISDFSLNDPLVLIYAEANVPEDGPKRLLLPAPLNQRRVPDPVWVARTGTSYVEPEDEETVRAVLRNGITLFPQRPSHPRRR
jgi:hypothetical protein